MPGVAASAQQSIAQWQRVMCNEVSLIVAMVAAMDHQRSLSAGRRRNQPGNPRTRRHLGMRGLRLKIHAVAGRPSRSPGRP